jgi:chromosome segregation ATPase
MPAPTFTETEFHAAIAGLQARQVRPTIRTIQSALGGRGSPERIGNLLRAWRDAQGGTTAPLLPPATVTAHLAELAPALWDAALAESRQSVGVELAALTARVAAETQAAAEAQAQVTERDQQLTAERAERTALVAEIAELRTALHAVASEQSRVGDGLSRQADAVVDLRSMVSGSSEALRTLLLDFESRARQDRDAAQRAIDALQEARAEAVGRAAAATELATSLRQQLAATAAAHAGVVADLTARAAALSELQQTHAGTCQELATATARAAAAVEQIAALERELVAQSESGQRADQRNAALAADLATAQALVDERGIALTIERDRREAELARLGDQLTAAVHAAGDSNAAATVAIAATLQDFLARLTTPPRSV